LIHVILRRRRISPLVAAPVSVILAANGRRYIAGLVDFREGRTDDWIGAFADAVTASAAAAQRLWAQTDALLDALVERAGSPRADSVARKIILGLPAQPVVSAEVAALRYDVTPTAARAALNRLEGSEVLIPTRVGRRRGREWMSDELFEVLDAFEHDLGQPGEGGKLRPTPAPTRPPRKRPPGTA
ncbi:MAG: hypothetical protein ACYDAD_15705, partial [Acidimicrobiales bacterium]